MPGGRTEESVKPSEMEARGSKTLVAVEASAKPSWLAWTLMKVARLLLLTVFWGGLGMGVGLFCGIVGVLIRGALLHASPDMSAAYRYVSIPLAILCGSCAFLWNLLRSVQAAARRRRGDER